MYVGFYWIWMLYANPSCLLHSHNRSRDAWSLQLECSEICFPCLFSDSGEWRLCFLGKIPWTQICISVSQTHTVRGFWRWNMPYSFSQGQRPGCLPDSPGFQRILSSTDSTLHSVWRAESLCAQLLMTLIPGALNVLQIHSPVETLRQF